MNFWTILMGGLSALFVVVFLISLLQKKPFSTNYVFFDTIFFPLYAASWWAIWIVGRGQENSWMNLFTSVLASLVSIFLICIYLFTIERPNADDYEQALLDAGGRDIPETYEAFLKTGFEESNKIRFLAVAFKLLDLSDEARERKFQELIDRQNEQIDESIRMDSADVINELGVRNAIIDNKKLIFKLSDNLDPLLKKARKILIKQGFTKGVRFRSPRKLFAYFF